MPTFLDSDGTADGVDCSYYGTSVTAPQVAGAFAALNAARPAYTVNQNLGALRRNGLAITDSRNVHRPLDDQHLERRLLRLTRTARGMRPAR